VARAQSPDGPPGPPTLGGERRPPGPGLGDPTAGGDDSLPAAPSAGLRQGPSPRPEVAPGPPRGQAAPAAFVDSSAIVALVDRDDATHAAAVEAYRGLVAAGYKLVTTNLVVAETFDLLSAGLGPSLARQWLRDHRLAVYHADEQDGANARRLILGASERRRLSYTDAVSLVVMDRLGIADAFAVDPNFLAETA
jgi:predicted nucleic acid-binding protein